jgi:superfamily I DNA/RNA helicase
MSTAATEHRTPSPHQELAIRAPLGPVLVVAGPGAGKTFCLIERIRHLIHAEHIAPQRICAFTFTNKAAQEIADRLDLHGGDTGHVKRGTLHRFCAELLREHGAAVGVRKGFGIADEDYQFAVLSRLGTPRAWQRGVLGRFSRYRFRGIEMGDDDDKRFQKYEYYLERRNVVDFDMLLLKATALLDHRSIADAIRSRYDYVLVDEFQDLNPVAFAFVRGLTAGHRNLFVVGDEEQSIYSWAGADPRVFASFINDFTDYRRFDLGENRRCPRAVVERARRLVQHNRSIFDDPKVIAAPRETPFPVQVQSFEHAHAEASWLIDDLRRDREAHGRAWGDYALLFRTNEMGGALEAELLGARVPCRMAAGRALADHPVVAYLMAALRVIAHPGDRAREHEFYRAVLPHTLFTDAAHRAEGRDNNLSRQLDEMARERKATDDARMIRRAQVEVRNLVTLGERHTRLDGLLHELLSQRVGQYQSRLDAMHDELTDPADDPEVQALAEGIEAARVTGRQVVLASMGGLEVALRGMFDRAQLLHLLLPGRATPALSISPDTTPTLGAALGTFKALQLLATHGFQDVFRDFVALDFEATGTNPATARITEVGAVRVRDGKVVDTFTALVDPDVPIPAIVAEKTGITDAMVAGQPRLHEVWPAIRDFLGRDLVIAHNGHSYDFPLLRHSIARFGEQIALRGYDSLPLARELHPGSRKLEELAVAFGVDPGASHRALDDARTLAEVFPRLNSLKLARARKLALPAALEYLAVGVALTDERCEEAGRLFPAIRDLPFFRHARSLDAYEAAYAARGESAMLAPHTLVDRLGGEVRRAQLQAERDADDRYPELMARLRRVMESLPSDTPLQEQIGAFLEVIVLSQQDGASPDHDRVNLLTLHSTKGLEFSRVYIVGVSNNDLLAGRPDKWSEDDIEEARRLLYVGMTRTEDRLVMTWASRRKEKVCDELGFLAEMGLV